MAISAMFGVNGVGKDTVAECLRYKQPEITVTSMSRLLMYILGITTTYDVREKVREEQYKRLEKVPQETMIKLEQEEYRYLLEKISQNEGAVLVLSHLISALRHGDKVQYLKERKIPDWFLELSENLIQLVAPADVISQRRFRDTSRNRNSDIEQILEHQALCNQEWERIENSSILIKRKMQIVENVDLEVASCEVARVLF